MACQFFLAICAVPRIPHRIGLLVIERNRLPDEPARVNAGLARGAAPAAESLTAAGRSLFPMGYPTPK